MSFVVIISSSFCDLLANQVLFGRFWRNNPYVFSFVPRCHGLLGSQKYTSISAFTFNGEGGNPAGIVLGADQFTQAQKQEIARLVGFPETAFVSNSNIAERNLEFFTPNKQIPHCGHATVATFSYLNQIGEIGRPNSSKETIDGIRDIIIEDGMAFMEQKPKFYKDISVREMERVMVSLSLNVDDLIEGKRPMVSNTGVSFMIIPLKETAALKAIKTDLKMISDISEEHDLIGFYAFTTDAIEVEHDVTTRMFAPRYAIDEEPATGMAAGNLSAYLFDHMNFTQDQIVIEQGYFMDPQSKSEIFVKLTVEDGKLVKIMAGGRAKVGSVKIVELD